MRKDYTVLAKRLAVFSLPLLAYLALVALVDPYNFVPGPSPVDEKAKEDVSFKLNYAMWKMLEYRRDPVSNILLGDSRMMSLDPDTIRAVSGLEYFNFAYGGGSLREAIDTFWFATRQTQLVRACIGMNLTTFNATDAKDRVSEVDAMLANPLLYLVNRNVVNATARIIVSAVTGRDAGIGSPVGDQDAFWRRQLDVTTKGYYENYRYPVSYLAELSEIAEYCRSTGIELSFIVFPSHADLQKKVATYGLEDSEARMKQDIARLGTVYDFEVDSPLTRDRANYRDPYHFRGHVMKQIVETVWGRNGTHPTPAAGN